MIGGLSAGAANKVGSFLGHEIGTFQKELARSLAHGSIGGLASMAQGGKFKHGFFAASFASMAGSGMEASNWGVFQTTAGGTVTAAVVGGTASALGGGKFANGAVTGAYTMLFNHLIHQKQVKNQDRFKGQLINDRNRAATFMQDLSIENEVEVSGWVVDEGIIVMPFEGENYQGIYQRNRYNRSHAAYTVDNLYQNGYISAVKGTYTTTDDIFTATGYNQRGQVTGYTLGNGLSTTRGYDDFGFPTTIQTPGIQNLEYEFDTQTGNLNWRKDVAKTLQEDFLIVNVSRKSLTTFLSASGRISMLLN